MFGRKYRLNHQGNADKQIFTGTGLNLPAASLFCPPSSRMRDAFRIRIARKGLFVFIFLEYTHDHPSFTRPRRRQTLGS